MKKRKQESFYSQKVLGKYKNRARVSSQKTLPIGSPNSRSNEAKQLQILMLQPGPLLNSLAHHTPISTFVLQMMKCGQLGLGHQIPLSDIETTPKPLFLSSQFPNCGHLSTDWSGPWLLLKTFVSIITSELSISIPGMPGI